MGKEPAGRGSACEEVVRVGKDEVGVRLVREADGAHDGGGFGLRQREFRFGFGRLEFGPVRVRTWVRMGMVMRAGRGGRGGHGSMGLGGGVRVRIRIRI